MSTGVRTVKCEERTQHTLKPHGAFDADTAELNVQDDGSSENMKTCVIYVGSYTHTKQS